MDYHVSGLATATDYWRRALAGLPEFHDLPWDRPRGAVLNGDTAAITQQLGAEADVDTIVAMVVTLLHRLGAGCDIPLYVSGDNLLLRIGLFGRPSFRTLVDRVRFARSAALQWPISPAEVANIVDSQRNNSRCSLFQVGVAINDSSPPQPAELWFSFDTTDNSSSVTLHYATELFDVATAESITRYLGRLTVAVAADPDAGVHELAILPSDVRDRLLTTWNNTHRALPTGNLVEWFEEQVNRTPDFPAVRSGDTTWSYSQFNAYTNRLARTLVARGVGPESVVAVLLRRSDRLIAAFFAILKAGGTYMPVDPDLPRGRIAIMLADAAPRVVISTSELARLIPADLSASLLAPDCAELSRYDPDNLPVHVGDIPIYILYTSGSTGTPKGVLMCADAIVNLVAWNLQHLPSGPGRNTVHYAALGFDPTIQEFCGTLLSGGTLVIPPEDLRQDPLRLARWLAEHKINDIYAPTTVVEALCATAVAAGIDLPDLTQIGQGGEALVLSEQAAELFGQRRRTLYNLYGPTETHAATAHLMPPSIDEWPRPAPIGAPLWNTKLYVLDDNLELVPPEVPGELYIGGICLARGYYKRAAQTADRFLPDPFGAPGARMYRSGDVVRWLPDGTLAFLGRTDHQVKIRGLRIELSEVEAAIRYAPEVLETVVVAAGPANARRLDAYLVAAKGTPHLNQADLVDAVKERMANLVPPQMIPATFTLLNALPVNTNGKVDRLALPKPAVSPVRAIDTTPLEQTLCRLVADALGTESVSVTDNFYMLGGNSLTAVAVAAAVRTELGVDLSVSDVLRFPTVAQWAKQIAADNRVAGRPSSHGRGQHRCRRPRHSRVCGSSINWRDRALAITSHWLCDYAAPLTSNVSNKRYLL